METKIVSFTSEEAVKSIQEGNVISFPTETVYGLGVVYDNYDAFKRLVNAKNRPPDKPFTLMGGNNFDFEEFAYLNKGIRNVIKKFVPGPLTLLLPPKEGLQKHVTLDSPAIGIRIAGLKELRDFIDRVGKPLLVPSANKSGLTPGKCAKDVYEAFNGEIPYIIDGGETHGRPSTIVDFSSLKEPKLIRQGDLSFEEVLKAYKGE